MKRDYKLYNAIFPVFMLFLMVPQLWLFSIISKFIIDGIVLLIISFIFYKKFNGELFKKSFIKVYLFGFLADFIGAIYMTIIFLVYDSYLQELIWGKYIVIYSENTYIHDASTALIPFIANNKPTFSIIFTVIFYISSFVLAGGLIYLLNYKFSFKKTDLTTKQKMIASLILAVITTPYTYFMPTEVLTYLPFFS